MLQWRHLHSKMTLYLWSNPQSSAPKLKTRLCKIKWPRHQQISTQRAMRSQKVEPITMGANCIYSKTTPLNPTPTNSSAVHRVQIRAPKLQMSWWQNVWALNKKTMKSIGKTSTCPEREAPASWSKNQVKNASSRDSWVKRSFKIKIGAASDKIANHIQISRTYLA